MKASPPTRPQQASFFAKPAGIRELFSQRALLIVAVCLAGTVFAVYAPSLNDQFILDDHRFTGDPRIQFSGHVWEYFSNYVWAQFTGGPPSFYRPVFILWMRLNFILSALSPWGWHLLSITKHVVVAVLLGVLAWKLLRDRTAALLASALFALHPAQTESVAWVTVPDPLMAIGIIGALLFYLRYVESVSVRATVPRNKSRKHRNKDESGGQLRWFACALAAYCIALFSKETAIVFPVIILGLAYIVARQRAESAAQSRNQDSAMRVPLKRALVQTLPFLLVTAAYFLLRLNALNGKLGATSQNLPLATVLLSTPANLWFYVKVMLWPVHSYAFANSDLAEQFSVSAVLVPALLALCAVAVLVAVVFWYRGKVRYLLTRQKSAGVEYAMLIGILVLILPFLVALNVNALNPGDFLHGRYTYLPLAGLALIVATAWHVAGKARIPLLFIAAGLMIAYSVLTLAQEKQWKDDLTLFSIAHDLAPRNGPVAKNLANAHVQLGLQLADEGRCGEAMPIFEQVTREYPQDWYAWAALGDCLAQLNNLPRAEESLHRAADLSHEPKVIEEWQQLRERMGLPSLAPAK